MGQTFSDLLERFWAVRNNREYRSDPERQEALIESMADTMQTVLEKLRDRLD